MKAGVWGPAWRLGVAAVVGVLLFAAVTNAIDDPTSGPTRSATADFTDVAGLNPGADVRIRGVQVGKVTSVDLRRDGGRSIGEVGFSLAEGYGLDQDSRLAIKYQALTGSRYLDVLDAVELRPGELEPAGLLWRAPTSMTQPSFDITSLFNGLQPVLETLSPDEVNAFTDNAATLLAGDGNGLGAMLDSINSLTRFASDRQQVIATLMANLAEVADALGGSAPEVVQILDWFNRPLDGALSVLDEFRKSDLYGPRFTGAVTRLLENLGLEPGMDIDQLLAQAFGSASDATDALGRLPVLLEGLAAPVPAIDNHCGNGPAELPPAARVLLNGQQVTLCNPA